MRLGAYFDPLKPVKSHNNLASLHSPTSTPIKSKNALVSSQELGSLYSFFSNYIASHKNSHFVKKESDYVIYEIIITPEQGGLEAQDFAKLLFNAYSKYCQRENIKVLKEVGSTHVSILEVKAKKGDKFPMCEDGLHKMTRASPYGNGKIHTSHAKVKVGEKLNISTPPLLEADIFYEPFKAPGPGGQHKNKTMSAIRATHKYGLSVLAVHSRSQHDNRAQASLQMKEKWDSLFSEYMRGDAQNEWQQRRQLELVRSYLDNHNCVVWRSSNKTRFQDFFKGQIDFSM